MRTLRGQVDWAGIVFVLGVFVAAVIAVAAVVGCVIYGTRMLAEALL